MPDPVFNVLFLCTGNSARSILAESILRRDGAGRFQAFSAGSRPNGAVDPMTPSVLEEFGYPTDGLRSKGWEEFAGPDAPVMDFVFTVCDQAAGEACPAWPGQPMTAHWGIEDPSREDRGEIWRRAAFTTAFRFMRNRVSAFAALPIESLERTRLAVKLREIGQLAGASSPRSDVA